MRRIRIGFVWLAGLLALFGCAGTRSTTGCAPPQLEIEQVHHQWEIVVRVFDVCPPNPRQTKCSLYSVLEDGRLAKIDDVLLSKPSDGEEGKFIGVYSNGKELAHGTEVVAFYSRSSGSKPVRASTKMFYH